MILYYTHMIVVGCGWPVKDDVAKVTFERVPPCVALEGQAIQDGRRHSFVLQLAVKVIRSPPV